jgi:co-chaperonin GroES (HSP10)
MQALHSNILFTFVDQVNTRGEFVNSPTVSGIVLTGTTDDSAKAPREAIVRYAGPECKSVKAGDRIVIPALRWTNYFATAEGKMWKTEESEIVGIIDQHTPTLVPIGEFVTFSLLKERKSVTSSGLIVVSSGTNEDTLSGTVIRTGNEVDPTLQTEDTIIFNKANFFQTVYLRQTNKPVSFLKDSEILFVREE